MKKSWQHPKLIVLVRGRQEEFILGVCKFATLTYPVGPGDAAPGCYVENCVECDAYHAT